MSTKIYEFDHNNTQEKYTFGKVARQSNGAVLLESGNTVILASVVMNEVSEVVGDFLPLTVQYIEKTYAMGKIPGGFFKRETKPSDFETLTSRIVDRALRPLFPKGFVNPIQITIMVLSADLDSDLQVLALGAASAALYASDIPVSTSVCAVRVGKIDDEIILNPTLSELKESTLDFLVAGSKENLMMIEMRSLGSIDTIEAAIDPSMGASLIANQNDNAMSEDDLVSLLGTVENALFEANSAYEEHFNEVAKDKTEVTLHLKDSSVEVLEYIKTNYLDKVNGAISHMAKSERSQELELIAKDIISKNENWDYKSVLLMVEQVKREIVRSMILNDGKRADGRGLTEVRPIEIETNILPSAHGSALFTRGQTQALVVLTIGGPKDAQMFESLTDKGTQNETFMVHYNFPGFSVGEASRVGPPGRRELGHGNLGKRALEPALSDVSGSTIRLVSEILESNGSSSMATVCGGSMALRASNVPMTSLVAGVAMGLVSDGERNAILTDIMGLEDHDGDMDFKVAGTREGITALQMDIKLDGVSLELLRTALNQARDARHHILAIMEEAEKEIEINEDALPSTEIFSIDPSRIVDIIGKAGATIREIIEKFEVAIDLDRDKGNVKVSGKSKTNVDGAKEHIMGIASKEKTPHRVSYKEGDELKGIVKRIVDFGAFVELPDGSDGLLHISKVSKERVNKVEDVLSIADEIQVVIVKQKGFKIELGRVF